MENKIGWIKFSGLIIGPILGSGIILIPPIVLETAGNWSLPAWVVISVLGLVFAFVFSFLSVLFPGEAGVSSAVEYALGSRFRVLSSMYLMGAGLFGPVAVLLIAEKYANPGGIFSPFMFECVVLAVCFGLLMSSITSIGRAALVLSSLAAVLLLSGGVLTLLFHSGFEVHREPFSAGVFGRALLLLFWCIVGWEVIGSYSGEIKDPKRTYIKAALFSALVITVVELSVAGALQYAVPPAVDVADVLRPVAGSFSGVLLGLLTLMLCINTFISFVGSISRLAASMADKSEMPVIFGARTAGNAPYMVLVAMTLVHVAQLVLVNTGILNIDELVAVANAFFLLNALIGILAAFKLFRNYWLKGLAGLLAVCFVVILSFSSVYMLGVCAVIMLTVFRKKRINTSEPLTSDI